MSEKSGPYGLLRHQAEAAAEAREQWRVDHDEAMAAWALNLAFEASGVIFRAFLDLDSKRPKDKRAGDPRLAALGALAHLFEVLIAACDEVAIESYDYPVSRDKLRQMLVIVKALRAGVKVFDPADAEAARAAEARGEVIGLGELRERLQDRHP